MSNAFDEYQQDAALTAPPDEDIPAEKAALLLAGLGAAGEAGEFAEVIKKHVFHKHPLDVEKLVKEAGDVLWYLAYGMRKAGIPFSRVPALNIEKLAARYPERKFSAFRSMNRKPGDV